MKFKISKTLNYFIVLILCISFSVAFIFNSFAGTNVNLIFGDNNGIRNANEFEWLAEGTDFRLKNNASKNVYDRFYLGWQKLPAKGGHKEGWYYFDEYTGLMKTGWFAQNGNSYFLSLINDGNQLGCALNGWWLIDGSVCHLDETKYTLDSMMLPAEAVAKGINYNDPTELLKSLLAKGANPFGASNSGATTSGPIGNTSSQGASHVSSQGDRSMQEDQIIRPTSEAEMNKYYNDSNNNIAPVSSEIPKTNLASSAPVTTSTPFSTLNSGTSFGDVASIRLPGDFVWEHDLDTNIWKLKVWSDNPNESRYYTGWQKLPEEIGYEGGWYYFDPQTAEMTYGWHHENGKSYFLGMLKQKQNLGRALKGWWLLDGGIFHFDENNYNLDNTCTVEQAMAQGIPYNQ